MSKRTLIGWFWISLCLVLASCGSQEDPGESRATSESNAQSNISNRPQVTPVPPPIDWLGAKALVASANKEFKAGEAPGSPQLVQPVANKIHEASDKLGDAERIDEICAGCNQEIREKTKSVIQALDSILTNLKGKGDRKINTLKPEIVSSIEGKFSQAEGALSEASIAYENVRKPAAGAANDNNNANRNGGSTSGIEWTKLIWPIAGGVAGAALIILAIFGGMRWRAGFWAKLDGHMNDIVEAHVRGVKKRQDEFGKHLAAVGDEQTKTSSRLNLIGGEVQALGRILRQGAFDSGGSARPGLDDYGRPEVKPVEPEFPAAAGEYLNKMKGNTLVVKPDFQNGILVNDADGKGELVLIRNASVPDDAQPLFVVPRVTQFQTKQEFHSYYERYYECQRPSAGDVWIIDPAIVSTVPGGWLLREKGVLEVR